LEAYLNLSSKNGRRFLKPSSPVIISSDGGN
jgi:hypothetical protein